jgi:hypothetical protein
MNKQRSQRPQLKALKITCTSSDCANNLHCFKKSRKMAESERGRCRSCGIDLIDWNRVHKRDAEDAAFVFSSLKHELVRHYFWHKDIDKKAVNHARRKGRIGIRKASRNRLIKYLSPDNPYDGRQTPYEGNVIYYAQHALACCCRTCLEYWHGIPKKEILSSAQIDYFTNLIMMYIDERMPNLTKSGEKIPPIRSADH